MYQRLRLLFIW